MKSVTFAPAVTGDSDEQLLTISEVAAVLGLGPKTVREYLARGELNGQFIRGRWRFRRRDLDEFLATPSNWEIRVTSQV